MRFRMPWMNKEKKLQEKKKIFFLEELSGFSVIARKLRTITDKRWKHIKDDGNENVSQVTVEKRKKKWGRREKFLTNIYFLIT